MIFIGINGDNTLGIVNQNSRTERKCLVLDLSKTFSIAFIFQRYRRNIIGRRRNIRHIGGIAHKVNRLLVLARMPVNYFIGNRNKLVEIKPRQTVLNHILNAVILLRIVNFTVKFVGDLEIHKVSSYLNRQFIVCKGGKRKTNIMQIGEISNITIFRFTEIVDKILRLIKLSLKGALKVHDLHGFVRVMLKHCCLQELRES